MGNRTRLKKKSVRGNTEKIKHKMPLHGSHVAVRSSRDLVINTFNREGSSSLRDARGWDLTKNNQPLNGKARRVDPLCIKCLSPKLSSQYDGISGDDSAYCSFQQVGMGFCAILSRSAAPANNRLGQSSALLYCGPQMRAAACISVHLPGPISRRKGRRLVLILMLFSSAETNAKFKAVLICSN